MLNPPTLPSTIPCRGRWISKFFDLHLEYSIHFKLYLNIPSHDETQSFLQNSCMILHNQNIPNKDCRERHRQSDALFCDHSHQRPAQTSEGVEFPPKSYSAISGSPSRSRSTAELPVSPYSPPRFPSRYPEKMARSTQYL